MILKRFIIELHGREAQPAEEGNAERWALDDWHAERLFSEWVQRTPDLDLEEGYRILVFSDDDSL